MTGRLIADPEPLDPPDPEALRQENDHLRTALAEARQALEDAQQDHEIALQQADTRNAEQAESLRAAERELGDRRAQLAAMRSYGIGLERRHGAILASRSWQMTAPIRWLGQRIGRRKPPPPFAPRLSRGGALPFAAGRALAATRLDDKLWGGYPRQAMADLEALIADPATRRSERAEAAWYLARWHGAHGDFPGAHAELARMHAADPGSARGLRSLLLESDCLIRRDDAAAAQALLEDGLRRKPDNAHLCLAMANTFLAEPPGPDRDARRLGWVNRIYARNGLAALAPLDPTRPLAVDNLTADAPPAIADAAGQPRVSIIMPVFQAATTLPFALRGLRRQTWANLEILVVDDCSSDDTVAVAEAVAAQDPRVRVIRSPRNQGAYAARNIGLRAVTGDFVTTHDADDWSHPQKIETQVRYLLDHPRAAASYSLWIRCSEEMAFRGLFRPWAGLISKNVSSLMFPRAVMDRLGGWAEARVGSDSEMMRRAEALYGDHCLKKIGPAALLSFSLHEERSLTRQSRTHVKTVYYGVRREMHEAASYWRHIVPERKLTLDPVREPRPFPVPASILPQPEEIIRCDLLVITDFAMDGGAFESTLNYVRAAIAAGLSVAIFHWRRYDLDITKPVNAELRDLAQFGQLRIVAPGERVRAETMIIGYPAILPQVPDPMPEVEADNLVVVVNQMASRLHGGGDPQYDPAALRDGLRELFGTEGIWAPISGLVQRLMRDDPRYPAPSGTVWVPLIDTGRWCADPLRWRGGSRAQPVVGRHARDHYTKWPTEAEALRAAYCADRPCSVELMGGAERALAVIGPRPANWMVHRYGSLAPRDFLARLDFFIHYPHEDYIEEFGRAVLEALAAGLPAVLPPVFRETFGEAAVYAEPVEVWDRIAALWADEAAYLAQARRGREFVLAESDWSQFPGRLARTLAGARSPSGATPDGEAAPDLEEKAMAR